MKAVVKNLLREIISFYFILRYGNPTKILRLLGGIGDHLLLTIIAKEIKKKNSLSNIWIISNSKDLYENNSNISGVINLKCGNTISQSSLKKKLCVISYTKNISTLPYQDLSPQQHIVKIMAEQAKVKIEGIDFSPEFQLTDKEKKFGVYATRQIAIQCIDEKSETAMLNKLWFRESFQSLVNRISERFPEYKIIQIGSHKDPQLMGVLDLRGQTSIRETAGVLHNSNLFIGTVGFLMHLSKSVDCKSVIIYGGREHSWQTGYESNINIDSQLLCAPCWKWNHCDFNRRCMEMITVDNVFEKVSKVLNFIKIENT